MTPNAAQIAEADFAIQVDFKPDTPDPTRVFRAMTDLIESFQYFDRQLVQSIDVSIQPVLLLEDIEGGSVKTWLRSVVSSADDTALIEGDWKKLVGRYLYRAKYAAIRFLEGKTQISDRKQLKELESELLLLSE